MGTQGVHGGAYTFAEHLLVGVTLYPTKSDWAHI